MKPLRQLCCGEMNSTGKLNRVLSILGDVIERYGEKTQSIIKNGKDDEKLMYGSFVARKLFESSSSAILARMDPARFLILQEYQQRAGVGYKAHERHAASIAWSGDIIPEKASNDLWNTEVNSDKFVRALLGGHLAEVYWKKAIESFSQDVSDRASGLWIEELSNLYEQKSQEPTSNGSVATLVLGVFRGKAQGCYSALSKGVHLEFVVDETVVLDPETVVVHMLDVVKLVSQLGYLSNHMDSVYTKIEQNTASELLLNVEKSLEL